MQTQRVWYILEGEIKSVLPKQAIPAHGVLISFDDTTAWEGDHVIYEILHASPEYPLVGALVVASYDYPPTPVGAAPLALVRDGSLLKIVEGTHNSPAKIHDYFKLFVEPVLD